MTADEQCLQFWLQVKVVCPENEQIHLGNNSFPCGKKIYLVMNPDLQGKLPFISALIV